MCESTVCDCVVALGDKRDNARPAAVKAEVRMNSRRSIIRFSQSATGSRLLGGRSLGVKFAFLPHEVIDACHCVAVGLSTKCQRMLGLRAEDDMVAVHAAFESTGLIRPFEVAGDRIAILLKVDSFCIEDPVPVLRLNDPVPGDIDRRRCSLDRGVCAAANTATKSSKKAEQIRDQLWRLIEYSSRCFNCSIPEPY